MGIEGSREKADKWAAEAVALLTAGWLGIGYTVVNRIDARKKLALAVAPESQAALKEWLDERQAEGYVVAIRYYVAKAPCRTKDSEFSGSLLLRHRSLGCEVFAELLPLTLDAEGRDSLVEALALRDIAEEFALVANATPDDGHITCG